MSMSDRLILRCPKVKHVSVLRYCPQAFNGNLLLAADNRLISIHNSRAGGTACNFFEIRHAKFQRRIRCDYLDLSIGVANKFPQPYAQGYATMVGVGAEE